MSQPTGILELDKFILEHEHWGASPDMFIIKDDKHVKNIYYVYPNKKHKMWKGAWEAFLYELTAGRHSHEIDNAMFSPTDIDQPPEYGKSITINGWVYRIEGNKVTVEKHKFYNTNHQLSYLESSLLLSEGIWGMENDKAIHLSLNESKTLLELWSWQKASQYNNEIPTYSRSPVDPSNPPKDSEEYQDWLNQYQTWKSRDLKDRYGSSGDEEQDQVYQEPNQFNQTQQTDTISTRAATPKKQAAKKIVQPMTPVQKNNTIKTYLNKIGIVDKTSITSLTKSLSSLPDASLQKVLALLNNSPQSKTLTPNQKLIKRTKLGSGRGVSGVARGPRKVSGKPRNEGFEGLLTLEYILESLLIED